jgi:hypothetical protein
VLIDEVEQHLHGRWQRELLPRLLEAFPNVQFVATTHSPIVLSSIDNAHVRVLRDFQIDSLQDATYGRDANALFEDVFGVSRRPEEMARKLDAIGRQLDSGNIEDAKRELENLASVLGEDDADIVRLRVLSGFLEDHEPQTAAGEDG